MTLVTLHYGAFYPDNPQLLNVPLLFTGESYPDQHGGDADVSGG